MGAGLQTTVTGPTYDSDAQLFFNAQTAAGVTLTTTQMNAVNQWVVDSKAAGIWTKFKAIYPMVGSTATSQKFNLKNPLDTNAAFRLNFVGGWTHSSNGAKPNGINAYADTFLLPSTTLSLNNTHVSFYSRTNDTSNIYFDMGTNTNSSSVANAIYLCPFITNLYYGVVNSNVQSSVSNTNTTGLYIASRTSATVQKLVKNTTISSFSVNSQGLSNRSIFISAWNNSGPPVGSAYFSPRECAFSTIGDGLTDLESQLFYQITEKYQVALGRNINALQSFYYNPAYNNETNAFLFSTQITDNTIQTATNTLVSDLKTANIFTKMKAIYPMVGGTATTHKFNLVNAQDTDAAYRLAFVGGWTHSANGAKANGTNAYADTKFIANGTLSLYNSHLSFYSRTSAFQPSGSCLIGVASNSGTWNNREYWALNTGGTNIFSGVQHSSLSATEYATSPTQINKLGFMVQSRLSATATTLKVFKNGMPLANATTSTTGQALNTFSVYLSALHWLTNFPSFVGLYDDSQCAFASIGDGLTDAEALAFYNAVQTFNTTLGRQV
jgi:hypothetical protein